MNLGKDLATALGIFARLSKVLEKELKGNLSPRRLYEVTSRPALDAIRSKRRVLISKEVDAKRKGIRNLSE